VTASGCSYGDAFHPTMLVPNSQDLGNQAVGGDTWTRGETLNLTLQASSRDKVTFFSHFNQRLATRPGEALAVRSPHFWNWLHMMFDVGRAR
jgi:hypothetical protein